MTRVIKAGGERVVPAPVVDARARAAAIVASAEAVREAARQDGFAAGRQDGLASATELLVRARAAAAAHAAGAETELRRLAVRIAEKILARELALASEAVVDVVRAALAGARARLGAALANGVELTVRADAALARGGCLVDTEVGTIDARLEVQLAAIERALLAKDAPP